MAGFKNDPIAEHAAVTELVHAVGVWRDAERHARSLARDALARPGVRSDVIAEALEMSRATMYRWVGPPTEQTYHEPSHRRDTHTPKPASGVATPSTPPARRQTARKGQGSAAGRSRVTRAQRAPLTLPGTDTSTLEDAPGRSAATPQGPTGQQRGSAATEAQGAKRPKRSNRKPSQT